MRTTVEISDDLFRQAKSRAALEGIRLRDLVEKGLRQVLSAPTQPAKPKRLTFPLLHSRKPGALSTEAVLSAADQAQLDEDQQHGGAV